MLHRRHFLKHTLAGTATASLGIRTLGAAVDKRKSPLLEPVHEATVCAWSAGHPRHDHQLIFPLDDGRLMLVW